MRIGVRVARGPFRAIGQELSIVLHSCKEDDGDQMSCIYSQPSLEQVWKKSAYDLVEHDLASAFSIEIPHFSGHLDEKCVSC